MSLTTGTSISSGTGQGKRRRCHPTGRQCHVARPSPWFRRIAEAPFRIRPVSANGNHRGATTPSSTTTITTPHGTVTNTPPPNDAIGNDDTIEQRCTTGWAMDASARGPLNAVGTFVGAAIVKLAEQEANGENVRVHGLYPSSMLTTITSIVGVAAALSLPVVGAVVDRTPYRRAIGGLTALIVVMITATQTMLSAQNWFPMLILEGIGGYLLMVHITTVFAYLPDLSADTDDIAYFNAAFNLRQYAAQLFQTIIVVVFAFWNRQRREETDDEVVQQQNRVTATVAAARVATFMAAIVSGILLAYSWVYLFSAPKPRVRNVVFGAITKESPEPQDGFDDEEENQQQQRHQQQETLGNVSNVHDTADFNDRDRYDDEGGVGADSNHGLGNSNNRNNNGGTYANDQKSDSGNDEEITNDGKDVNNQNEKFHDDDDDDDDDDAGVDHHDAADTGVGRRHRLNNNSSNSRHHEESKDEPLNLLTVGFRQVFETISTICRHYHGLKWFMCALLWSPEAGSGVTLSIATTYITSYIGLSGLQISLASVATLVLNIPGSYFGLWVSNRLNPLNSFRLALLFMTTMVALTALTTGPGTAIPIYAWSFVWGLAFGWIYPTQRVLFCTLIPKNGQEMEYMGMFAFVGNILSWVPTLIFTTMNERGVDMRWSLSVLSWFFFLAFLCSIMTGSYQEAAEQVGRGDEERAKAAIRRKRFPQSWFYRSDNDHDNDHGDSNA